MVLKKDNKLLSKKNKIELRRIQNFKFMRGIRNLKKLHFIIRQSNFSANSYIISQMEEIFNIKFIIIQKKYYDTGEYNKMIECDKIYTK